MNDIGRKILTETLNWLRAGGDDGEVAFNLTTWDTPSAEFRDCYSSNSTNYNTRCDSVCCIGGYVERLLVREGIDPGCSLEASAMALDVDPDAYEELTHPNHNTFNRWAFVTPADAADALERFINTEGTESW